MSNLPAWLPITPDELLSSMTWKEREDFGKTSVGVTVVDRVIPILAALVLEIRGYIGSNSGNTLSADQSLIPGEFQAKALAIARFRVLITIPGYTPGEGRKLEYEKADTFFNNVAKGIIKPRPAPDAEPSQVPQGKVMASPRIRARSRRYSRDQQDGI